MSWQSTYLGVKIILRTFKHSSLMHFIRENNNTFIISWQAEKSSCLNFKLGVAENRVWQSLNSCWFFFYNSCFSQVTATLVEILSFACDLLLVHSFFFFCEEMVAVNEAIESKIRVTRAGQNFGFNQNALVDQNCYQILAE